MHQPPPNLIFLTSRILLFLSRFKDLSIVIDTESSEPNTGTERDEECEHSKGASLLHLFCKNAWI